MVLSLLAAVAVTSAGCLARVTPVARPGDDPYDRLTLASPDSAGRWIIRNPVEGPAGLPTPRGGRPLGSIPRPCKVHPLLAEWVRDSLPSKRETLLVAFRDTVRIPRFPRPNPNQPRTSPGNVLALLEARRLADTLMARRHRFHDTDSAKVVTLGGVVLEKYWLVQALQIEVALGQVPSLVAEPRVVFIQPRRSGEEPPVVKDNGVLTDDVAVGRDRVGSDSYARLGWGNTWVGLLDTGVLQDHEMLASPTHWGLLGDCVGGSADCIGGKPEDECKGHGTSSAAILVSNAVPTDRFNGVTWNSGSTGTPVAAALSSYKVYYRYTRRGTCLMGLDACAAIRGFQAAVVNLDQVIVAEIQSESPPTCSGLGTLEQAADNAFEAGAVVIAANGNWNATCTAPSNRIGSPASARRVIGVGAYDANTASCISSQSWGTTADGRFKPDLQAPTNVETAGIERSTGVSPQEAVRSHTGTSGSTPFAAGVAAIVRSWLTASGTTDPGAVYAHLIASCDKEGTFGASVDGAGKLFLQSAVKTFWEKKSIESSGRSEDVVLDLTGLLAKTLDVAIWWPEKLVVDASGLVVDTHNDIDLEILDATGKPLDSSAGFAGVFQRASILLKGVASPVTIRVKGTAVPYGPQTVYLAAIAR